VIVMPTELPPHHEIAVKSISWVDRTLNWTAYVVGVGLCFWVVKAVDLPF
jgi:hypothetical protein